MHTLRVGAGWATQIAAIRDAHSDHINLIRFDNTFYRTCRDSSASFRVSLHASGGGGGTLQLDIRERDFYITELMGEPMGRYASTFNLMAPSASSLDHAIHSLAARKIHGDEAFRNRSLVVFCVAESIRNDYLATELDQTIRASSMTILGVSSHLKLHDWWHIAHQWGQAAEAIHQTLSARSANIFRRSPEQLTTEERRHSERVDLDRVPLHLYRCARTTKVLKRTG